MKQMANGHEKELTFGDKIAAGIHKNRKNILIVCAAVVVIVVAVGIGTAVSSRNAVKAMEAIEAAEASYDDWRYLAEDDEARDTQADELKAELSAIIDDNRDGYPDMKAQYLLGNVYFSLEQYTEAAEAFAAVSRDYPDMYLAPAALMNQAVAYEMAEDTESALDRYQYVVDNYAQTSAEAAHALFSIARIYDAMGNVDLSAAVFEQVISDYPDTEWAKLAQTRLIILK